MNILLLHGPNLNLLGAREPEHYGAITLDEINGLVSEEAAKHGAKLKAVQSNSEGSLVDAVHHHADWAHVLIINPGAYTHTSVALRDAIAAVGVPTIEVHLSNVYRREEFRHHSYIAPVAVGQITGFGADSYRLAVLAAVQMHEEDA